MAKRIVGLDLGEWSFKAVVASSTLRKTVVTRLVRVPLRLGQEGLPDDGARTEALAGLREEIALPADEIVCGIHGDEVSVRDLRLPAAAMKQIEQVIPFELDGQIPFDIEEAVIEHRVLGRSAGSVDLMAMAVRKSRIERSAAMLAEAGMDPRTVTFAPLIYEVLLRGVSEPVVILDIGHRNTNVDFLQGGRSVGGRTLPHGGKNVTRRLMEAGRLSWEAAEKGKHAESLDGTSKAAQIMREEMHALGLETRRTVAAHVARGWETPVRVYLCGGGAEMRGIGPFLAEDLGLPVEPLTVFRDKEAPDDLVGSGIDAALALAYSRVDEVPRERRIDFRRGALAYRGDVDYLRSKAWGIGAGLAVILLAWLFATWTSHRLLTVERVQQIVRLQGLTETLLGVRISDFDQAEELLSTRKQDKPPMPDIDAFDVLDEISNRIHDGIVHDTSRLEIKPNRVVLQGEVDTEVVGDANQLSPIDLIKESFSSWKTCVNAVKVGRTSTTTDGQRLTYSMEIETRCPGLGKGD